MDGIPNGEEARLGTSPFSSDTDGDGLPDSSEGPWVSSAPAVIYDLGSAANLLDALSDSDNGSLSVPLPFPITVHGEAGCTNLSISLNGFLS